MRLFLGVDGGQSSTVAVIADESGRVLGAGSGGPCNHVAAAEGRAKFARAMTECLGGACRVAGLDTQTVSFEAACLGFSGGVADKDAYSREVIRSAAFKITIDAEIALTGATAGQPGIIVIAGTGSIAFGRNGKGKLGRAGGWGYVFGDEGGAFDIARQALRAALATEEGWGPKTALHASLLSATGAKTANQLMHEWYTAFDRAKVAKFAPLVDVAADGGDSVAQAVLQMAGRQLGELAGRVYRTLFKPGELVQVSYIGGVFKSSLLTKALRAAVAAETECEISQPRWPPAAGAVWEALGMAGIRVELSEIPRIKN